MTGFTYLHLLSNLKEERHVGADHRPRDLPYGGFRAGRRKVPIFSLPSGRKAAEAQVPDARVSETQGGDVSRGIAQEANSAQRGTEAVLVGGRQGNDRIGRRRTTK